MYVSIAHKVCCDGRDIALTIRDRVFEEGEEQLIDMHDVKVTRFLTFLLIFTLLKLCSCTTSLLHVVLLTEFHTLEIAFIKIHVCSLHVWFLIMPLCICLKFQCKEWGFLLKKLFGVHLGTGDYGHLVIDHSAMLLRQFRSLYKYSGQGFEASHKLHRNLYSKATNHDASAPGQSCKLSLIIISKLLLTIDIIGTGIQARWTCCPPTYLAPDDPRWPFTKQYNVLVGCTKYCIFVTL